MKAMAAEYAWVRSQIWGLWIILNLLPNWKLCGTKLTPRWCQICTFVRLCPANPNDSKSIQKCWALDKFPTAHHLVQDLFLGFCWEQQPNSMAKAWGWHVTAFGCDENGGQQWQQLIVHAWIIRIPVISVVCVVITDKTLSATQWWSIEWWWSFRTCIFSRENCSGAWVLEGNMAGALSSRNQIDLTFAINLQTFANKHITYEFCSGTSLTIVFIHSIQLDKL